MIYLQDGFAIQKKNTIEFLWLQVEVEPYVKHVNLLLFSFVLSFLNVNSNENQS